MLLVAAALLALAQAHPWGCGTPVRVDAAQRLSRANIGRWSAPLPPLAHWVDASEPFPLRVYFDAPEQQPYAERIVAAVGVAYQRTVTEWGFWPPLLVEGEPYYIYIGDPGAGAAAYTAPYLANAATPHEDAFTYIVVRPGLSDVALDVTVAHELNHASQAAMDMSEPSAFFESTATYVESLVFPAGAALAGQLITVFQSQAHLPLEYAAPGPSDGYEYGASLWLSFLAHVYGADDPAWIRALWEESVQVGPTNEPDHRDVLDGWLADRGGQAHAIEEFGRWRFFVGAYADEQHLPSADKWQEVPFSASYTTTQLPVLDKGPQAATRPRPSGCNYASLSLGGSETLPIRFRFEGDAALAWDVSVLEIALDATSSYQVMELGEDARGELRIEPDDVHRAVLVICQSIADGFDLDEKTWPAGDYRYDIEVDVPAPTILEATPTAIERGVHGADIVLRGDGFVEGLTVALSGEHAAVHDVRVLSKSEIQAKLTIAPSAALGSRDVIVTNPGGAFATATGMLDIVEPQTSSSSESAGGCSIGSFGSRPVWLLASLALLACRRRRASAFLAAALVFGIASVAHAGPPSDGYVESATHPIRVHYANGANAAVAQEALGYAEEAWQKLFVELGFPEPTTLDDNDAPIPGIWLYVDPTSANLAQALGDNAATPHTDCLTRIFVASTSPSTILKSIVVTEMTQATTLTVDCGESVFAWKSAGVALASYVAPDDTLFPTVMLPVFQASPHAGLDCVFQGDMFWYHYGAALFWRFVDEAYGQGDGALLASLWEASKQNGTVLSTGTGVGVLDVDNEPDVLDAVATVAVPFDEAFSEFTRWRYFVGTRDDGQHFADGSKWFGAEVGIDRQLTLAELPVVAAAPVMPLADYGSSYIELDLSGLAEDKGIGWSFAGDPLVRWSADMLLVRGDNSAETHTLDVAAGSGVVDAGGFARAVLAISNLSDGTHDADTPSCNTTAAYTYDLAVADVAPPPEVLTVDPNVLSQGQRYDAFVTGNDFDAGATVSFGDGVDVSTVTVVDATTLAVTVSVRADAATGLRDVTVTNANGKSDALEGAISIAAPGDAQVGGCGCRIAKPAPRGAFVLFALALALARVSRRREAITTSKTSQGDPRSR